MEDNYAKILWEGYGLRFYGGTRMRTGFVCKTDVGLREVKKARQNRNGILFEHEVKEHLYKKGFQDINRFYKTTEGSPFFALDGNCYVLEEPMNAQSLDDSKKENFPKAAVVLATMHIASSGHQGSVERSNLGILPGLYKKRKNELIRIKKRIDRQSCFNELDLMVMQNFDYYLERVKEAEELLLTSGYEAEMERATQERIVCHNAFKGENIRQDEMGKIYVTGFGKCAFDSPLTDLAAFFRRYLKKTDGDIEIAAEILEAYSQKRQLSSDNIRILQGMLTYPDKFMRLCNEYYNKRRSCVSGAMQERMGDCILDQSKNDLFLEAWKKL